MEKKAFQIAVELKEPVMKDGGRFYREFLDALPRQNPPFATQLFSRPLAGNYDTTTHVLYALADADETKTFAQKAEATGLTKVVHIDEF